MARFIEPLVLEGRYARLVPLTDAHHEALARAAADGELWKLWFTSVPSPEGTAQYIATALEMRNALAAVALLRRASPVGLPGAGPCRSCRA